MSFSCGSVKFQPEMPSWRMGAIDGPNDPLVVLGDQNIILPGG
jgi:hypothetical protein